MGVLTLTPGTCFRLFNCVITFRDFMPILLMCRPFYISKLLDFAGGTVISRHAKDKSSTVLMISEVESVGAILHTYTLSHAYYKKDKLKQLFA